MATRLYLPAEGSGVPAVSPSFDAGWEQSGQMTRLRLLHSKRLSTISALADTGTRTVPITTSQDIGCNQWVSEPIPPQRIIGTVSAVVRVYESANTANVTLAFVARVVSQDGQTARGTLFSTFSTGTEFPLVGSTATRIVAVSNVTGLSTMVGDRLVVELGGHAAGPTAATSYTMRVGCSAASDFALTAALTTDLNPWVEFSQDFWDSDFENYRFVNAPGLSTNRP